MFENNSGHLVDDLTVQINLPQTGSESPKQMLRDDKSHSEIIAINYDIIWRLF